MIPFVAVIVFLAQTAVGSRLEDSNGSHGSARRPNVILMVVDDSGFGDFGCYGNLTSRTPAIDKLAADGARLTQFYVASPVCTPSRAAILTGRLPTRMGMESAHPNFRVLNSPASPGGLPREELTLAELLKQAGYATGMVGKWHLGIHNGTGRIEPWRAESWDAFTSVWEQNGELLPIEHGFESFYGMPVTNVQACGNRDQNRAPTWLFLLRRLPPALLASLAVILLSGVLLRWWGLVSTACSGCSIMLVCILCWLIFTFTYRYTLLSPQACLLYRNSEIIEQPVLLSTLTERLDREALDFITKQSAQSRPFFLYYSFVKLHTALHTGAAFVNRSGKGAFVDNVEELDWSVGRVVDHLKQLQILNDTLIILTSDNGPFLEEGHEAGTAGSFYDAQGTLRPLRGGKGQNYEGGIRVVGVFHYPARIPPHVTHHLASTLDIVPTVLRFASHGEGGREDLLQMLVKHRVLDGVDLSELLTTAVWRAPAGGSVPQQKQAYSIDAAHSVLFHYCGNDISAVRLGHYKVHFAEPAVEPYSESDELFCRDCCPHNIICGCGDRVLSAPVLYDLHVDPSEQAAVPVTSALYTQVIESARAAILEHQRTFNDSTRLGGRHARNQLEMFARPWLMPCCGASCKCCKECSEAEQKEHDLLWKDLK